MNRSNNFQSSIFRAFLALLLMSGYAVGCTSMHLPTATSPVTAKPTSIAKTPLLPTLTPSPTSAIQLHEEQLKGVSIRFWHPYSGAIGATFNQLANEFSLQNQWQIAVTSEEVSGVDLLKERVDAALEHGNSPHLILIPLYQALGWNQGQVTLVDWSIYSDDVQWGLSASEKQQFYPNIWEASFVGGHRWGIPARRVSQLLLYNASWARELGFTAAPRTLTEFQDQSCSIQSKGAQISDQFAKGYFFTHDYPTILGWITAFGAQITSSDVQSYQFKSIEVREAFVYLRKLYERGCMLIGTDLDPIDVFAQRQALFAPLHSAQIHVVEQTMQNAANRDLWTVLPFPTANDKGATILYGTDFVLLRTSEQEQLAAWLFVRWLLEEENQQRLAEETYGLPLRKDVGERLQNQSSVPAAYRVALEYLPLGSNEPLMASWDTIRWAVGDASRQLVAWYFTLEQVPSLVELLDKTAADLHSQKP